MLAEVPLTGLSFDWSSATAAAWSDSGGTTAQNTAHPGYFAATTRRCTSSRRTRTRGSHRTASTCFSPRIAQVTATCTKAAIADFDTLPLADAKW